MWESLILGTLEAIARGWGIAREALAKKLEDIATGIRNGDLIPEEAFDRAKQTHADTKSARDKLPG